MQTRPATAGVVRNPACLCAAIRTRRCTAAASPAAMGGPHAAEMGRRRPALGLGRNLTAAQAISQLADVAEGLCERIAGGQTTAKTRLQGAQVEQDRVAQPVIAPFGELFDNLVGRAL